MKRPAYQHYVGDWHSDTQLQRCSLAARGLWTEMLGLMHMGIPYGYLTVQMKDTVEGYPLPDLAAWIGRPLDEVAQAFAELDAKGVFSRDPITGHVFSRRMVRDEDIRRKRAEGGKKSLDHPNVPKRRTTSNDVLSVEDEDEENISTNQDFCLDNTESPPEENLITRGSPVLAGQVYEVYPRHVARDAALKSITKAAHKIAAAGIVRYVGQDGKIQVVPIENLVAAVGFLQEAATEFARSPSGAKGDFVPYGSTWFNQGHYTDDRREWYRNEQPRNGNGNGSNGARSASAHTVRTLTNLSAAERAIQRERERAKESETDNRSH